MSVQKSRSFSLKCCSCVAIFMAMLLAGCGSSQMAVTKGIDSGQVGDLLARKLADPTCALSDSESIALLTSCIAEGAGNAKKIAGKGSVIMIGDTGGGEGTFVNYLLGCNALQKTSKELGIGVSGKALAIKSKLECGLCDEIMLAGHAKNSRAFTPQVMSNPNESSLAYCDCSGFLSDRGAEINIASLVNTKLLLQEAEYVKFLILINYHSLLADRDRGITDILDICTQLFGSTVRMEYFQDALLLGVTQVPEDIDLGVFRKWLVKGTSRLMEKIFTRLFLYDSVGLSGEDFWSGSRCISEIAALRGIPKSESCRMLQTALKPDDEQKLERIVGKQREILSRALHSESYDEAGSCWQSLRRIRVIDNICVERILNSLQLQVQYHVSKHVAEFKDCVVRFDFDVAQRHLAALRVMDSSFDKMALDLDLNELECYYSSFKKKQLEEREVVRYHKEERESYAEEIKRPFSVIEQQEVETGPSTLLSGNTQEISKPFAEVEHLGMSYEEEIPDFQAGMSYLNQAFSFGEAECEKRSVASLAFGAEEWKQYFGEVGSSPDLPRDIDAILDSQCPIWTYKKIKDTHLLVLIPATLDGVPFTLCLLEKLINRPKDGGYRAQYRCYHDEVKTRIGEASPGCSYWVLMARYVLENSRSKEYSAQKELVRHYAKKAGLCYDLPHALEAATAILVHHVRSGERLFSDIPWTYTRCRELVGECPVVVGGFGFSGLVIYYDGYVSECGSGVACCRRF
jgi:hypothetical protein